MSLIESVPIIGFEFTNDVTVCLWLLSATFNFNFNIGRVWERLSWIRDSSPPDNFSNVSLTFHWRVPKVHLGIVFTLLLILKCFLSFLIGSGVFFWHFKLGFFHCQSGLCLCFRDQFSLAKKRLGELMETSCYVKLQKLKAKKYQRKEEATELYGIFLRKFFEWFQYSEKCY